MTKKTRRRKRPSLVAAMPRPKSALERAGRVCLRALGKRQYFPENWQLHCQCNSGACSRETTRCRPMSVERKDPQHAASQHPQDPHSILTIFVRVPRTRLLGARARRIDA
jgi:hypothetical protein